MICKYDPAVREVPGEVAIGDRLLQGQRCDRPRQESKIRGGSTTTERSGAPVSIARCFFLQF